MAQPKKQKSPFAFFRWLLLLPIPALWCVLNHYNALAFLENKSLDWRFQFRGELESPVEVIYVNVDSISLSKIGGWPWSRAYFSRVSSALIKGGHAKAVGFDFVFSDLGSSESVDEKKLVEGNKEFFLFLNEKPEPPVVLAASYAGHKFLDINGTEQKRVLPLIASDKRKIDDIEPPEIPAFQLKLNQKRFENPPFKGLIDTLENGTRVVPAWAPNAEGKYFHMALELARLYWGLPPGSIEEHDDHIAFMRPDGSVQAKVPLRDRQLLDINWFTSWKSPRVKQAEFADIFELENFLTDGNAEQQKAAKQNLAQFKDAVVLIGPVDPFFQDLAPTSLDARFVPKVSVHGNLLKTIVSGLYLKRTPTWHGVAWVDYAIVFALTVIVTALPLVTSTRSWIAALMKGLAVVAVVVYIVIAFEVFKTSHLILPFTAPLGAAFTTSFAGLIWQVLDEQKAKGRIKGMFGTYISPQLVEQMVESGEDPQLGGHQDEITAYFSDIQAFSSFSEVLTPEKLVDLMNEYLTACTDIVQAQGGTLDKYIGDAVVAMFGAPIPLPDHAYRACVATQLVHVKLNELRTKWRDEGEKWPEIVKKMQSRIGLNSGQAIIGNMGSRTRFNYTMMGDNVNLAARMESGSKSWGVYSMCSEATKTMCEKYGDRVVFRPLSRLVVKGRSQAVPVYEIVGLKETVTDQARECIALFEQALAKYYARDWDGALALFAKSRDLEPNVPGKTPGVVSNPSIVYIEKVVPERIEEPPGPDWDGRYEMKEK
jgi:adenylate cyclase